MEEKNFLKMVPKKNESINYEINDDGKVNIIIKRDGLLDRIVRKFLDTPKRRVVELDDLGSFVWKQIDGEANFNDISKKLLEHFGDKAKPLYKRLATYTKILRNNDFIIIE